MSDPTPILGLDLGQAADYSALAGALRFPEADGPGRYDFGLIHRWDLGTPYTASDGRPTVLSHTRDLLARPALAGALVAVDATGVGRPVVEVLRAAGLPVVPVVITGGHASRLAEDGCYHVPKKELVFTTLALLQQRKVRFAKGPYTDILVKELLNFRVKVSTAGHEQFEAWRDGQNDDLVLAVCLAVWLGERGAGAWVPSADPAPSPFARPPAGVFLDRGEDEGYITGG